MVTLTESAFANQVCFGLIFINNKPMAIQTISLTRQMMPTKMPKAAERPRTAVEMTKPPS